MYNQIPKDLDYSEIIPINLHIFNKPAQASREEAVEYFHWFLSQIPSRISALKGALNSSGTEWHDDYSLESLEKLGRWLTKHMQSREVTEPELQDMQESIKNFYDPKTIELSQITLTGKSISLLYDSGIYFAESLRKQNADLNWQIDEASKSVDYNQPVLAGFKSGVTLNPRRVFEVLGFKIVKGKMIDLKLLAATWSSY